MLCVGPKRRSNKPAVELQQVPIDIDSGELPRAEIGCMRCARVTWMQHAGCGKFGVQVVYSLDSVDCDAATSRPRQEALRSRPHRRLPQVVEGTDPPPVVVGLP